MKAPLSRRPPNTRTVNEIVKLREVNGLSFVQIGKMYGISRQAAAETYYRFKRRNGEIKESPKWFKKKLASEKVIHSKGT